MKKNIIIAMLVTVSGLLSAQIEVTSSNTVNIGTTEAFHGTFPAITTSPDGVVEVNAYEFIIRYDRPRTSGLGTYFSECGLRLYNEAIGVSGYAPSNLVKLTGLANRQVDIGNADNQINQIYAYQIYASGNFIGILTSSDAKLKTNIRELPSMRERISKLRPVMYDFTRNGSGEDVSKNEDSKNRVGFIAQEIQDIFPDLIAKYKLGKKDDAEELLAVDYSGLIPYLTKAIQEQNSTIEAQSITIQKLTETVDKQQKQIAEIQSAAYANFAIDEAFPNIAPQQASSNESNVLHQNVPNPFSTATVIKYQLSGDVANAKICIYNLMGMQLQCYELPVNKDESAIEVRPSSLQAGMYLYSLIVDNQLVDTKRMILTE